MERIVLVIVLGAAAALVAAVLRRRRPDAPTQGRVAVPAQLDRADFADPDKPWLVAVFTSDTCASCERATAKARILVAPDVAYDEVAWQRQRDLHERYKIDTVPVVVVADGEGVVRRGFAGTPDLAELIEAFEQVRRA